MSSNASLEGPTDNAVGFLHVGTHSMGESLATIFAEPRKLTAVDPGYDSRQRHIRIAGLLAEGHFDAEQLARLEGVTVDTIEEWRNRVVGYDDPDAEGVRRLLAERDHGREARLHHIRVVALLVSGNWTGDQLARMEGVTRQTIYHWREKVLSEYDDPEAGRVKRQARIARDRSLCG